MKAGHSTGARLNATALLLAAFCCLSLLDWAATTYSVSAGRLGLAGKGLHEANPVAVWAIVHFGGAGLLAVKALVFAVMLAIVAGLRAIEGKGVSVRWVTIAALTVAVLAQAAAAASAVLASVGGSG